MLPRQSERIAPDDRILPAELVKFLEASPPAKPIPEATTHAFPPFHCRDFGPTVSSNAIGVPLAVVEPRITAAVFGLFWPDLAEVASQITIPIEFDLQWHDEYIDRQSGLVLFDRRPPRAARSEGSDFRSGAGQAGCADSDRCCPCGSADGSTRERT